MESELKIAPSDEQIDVLLDYSLNKSNLVMVPGERAWIMSHVKKISPLSKILSAHLDTFNAVWIVKIYTN